MSLARATYDNLGIHMHVWREIVKFHCNGCEPAYGSTP